MTMSETPEDKSEKKENVKKDKKEVTVLNNFSATNSFT